MKKQLICTLAIISMLCYKSSTAQYVTIPTNFATWLSNNGYASCISGSQLDTTCSAIINEDTLICAGQGFTDLNGLQYFKNLVFLSCGSNPINSLPSLSRKIKYLACGYTGQHLATLPTLPDSLEILTCNDDSLVTLPALPPHLKQLLCFNNKLISLPALPSGITYISCDGNYLTSLPVLPDSLTMLRCNDNILTTLPTLPNKLTDLWCFSQRLGSFTSLPELPDSMYDLQIEGNPNLKCLPRIKRIVQLFYDHTVITCAPNHGHVDITNGGNIDFSTVPICTAGNANNCTVLSTTVTITPNTVSICPGESITPNILLNGALPPYTYAWSPSTGISSTNILSPAFSPTVNTSYTLTITDGEGGITTAFFVVNVVPNLDNAFTYSFSNTTCGEITGHIIGGIPPYHLQWSPIANNDTIADRNYNTQLYIGPAAHNLNVTITDSLGCTGVVNNIIVSDIDVQIENINTATPPILPDTLVMNATGGIPPYTYNWTSGETTDTIYENTTDYAVVGIARDAAGCVAFDTLIVGCANQCVWPGDANYDGACDNIDLLPIGLAYGGGTWPRTHASLNWVAQPMLNWPDTLADGTNYKHIDCNGDGHINADDTLAIIQNFSLTHPRSGNHEPWRSGAPELYVSLMPDTTHANDTLKAFISLGDALIPANNIYGIVFTLNYDALVVDTNKTSASFGTSWLGSATDKISIAKDLKSSGELKCAITRIDHTTRSGNGQIGVVSFVITTDNINGKNLAYYNMQVTLSDIVMIDDSGNILQVNGGADSTKVEFEATGINEVGLDKKITIYPNPATNNLIISSSEALINNIRIVNVIGKEVTNIKVADLQKQNVDVSKLNTGLYFIEITTNKGSTTKRFVRSSN